MSELPILEEFNELCAVIGEGDESNVALIKRVAALKQHVVGLLNERNRYYTAIENALDCGISTDTDANPNEAEAAAYLIAAVYPDRGRVQEILAEWGGDPDAPYEIYDLTFGFYMEDNDGNHLQYSTIDDAHIEAEDWFLENDQTQTFVIRDRNGTSVDYIFRSDVEDEEESSEEN